MIKGFFVTGTDTGVGKTIVSCGLTRALRKQQIDAVGFKPVVTGKVGDGWSDAIALHEASDKCEPIEKICPLRFAQPLAPTLAARAEGLRAPDLSLSRRILTQLCAQHDVVIVEGIGGALTPLDEQTLVLDFAAQIAFPILIVCKAGLGTINHTLLTIREIQRANLAIIGIIMNCHCATDVELAAGAKEEIERISGQQVIATLPYLGATTDFETSSSSQITHASVVLASQINITQLFKNVII